MSLLSIRHFFVAAMGVAALVAHAQPINTSSEEAKIKESRRLQTQALAKNDLDTVVKYWDPAITIRRALGHPVDGAIAARKLLEPPPNQNPATAVVYQQEATSVAVSSNWPLAYEEAGGRVMWAPPTRRRSWRGSTRRSGLNEMAFG